MSKRGINRRSFIKTSAAGMVGAGLIGQTPLGSDDTETKGKTARIKEYRTLGRTGFKVSDIGCGGLPPVAVLQALLDSGLNYIDTAEGYGRGEAERNVGQAIQGRDRKSLFITTKLGLPRGKNKASKQDFINRFNKCLERLKTDYVDCLMIHGPSTVEQLKNEAFHAAFKQLKGAGKARFCGLSNHGGHYSDVKESMEKVLLAAAEDGRFDVFLMVYNFLQREQGENVFKACKEKNIGVTLMKTNPVGKYYLMDERVKKMKEEGRKIPDFYNNYVARLKGYVDQSADFIKRYNLTNPAAVKAAAMKFVLSNPQVHAANYAFKTFEDIDEIIQLSGGRLSQTDTRTLALFEEGCSGLYCRHACGLCESYCPQRVPVNTIMRYNHYFDAQGREKEAIQLYAKLSDKQADTCEQCTGSCEKACPYGVPIQGLLVQAHQNLSLV